MTDTALPILVVDDLRTMTRIVDTMLRKCGFKNIDQIHDATTALAKLREQSYLFAITDREMPGMSGTDFVREVRADPKLSYLPIILMSASSDAKSAEEAVAVGANAFLIKPFDMTTLRDVIGQIVRSPS